MCESTEGYALEGFVIHVQMWWLRLWNPHSHMNIISLPIPTTVSSVVHQVLDQVLVKLKVDGTNIWWVSRTPRALTTLIFRLLFVLNTSWLSGAQLPVCWLFYHLWLRTGTPTWSGWMRNDNVHMPSDYYWLHGWDVLIEWRLFFFPIWPYWV